MQRTANRIKAVTGVDVLNARDLEAAFDQAVRSNNSLRESVTQAVQARTSKLPADADFSLEDYMAYMQA